MDVKLDENSKYIGTNRAYTFKSFMKIGMCFITNIEWNRPDSLNFSVNPKYVKISPYIYASNGSWQETCVYEEDRTKHQNRLLVGI